MIINLADIPKPTGNEIYWVKWIDAFDDDQTEEITEEHKQGDDDQEPQFEYQDEDGFSPVTDEGKVSYVKSIMTPFGILPLTEQSKASSSFKLWVGHTNFKLTNGKSNTIDFYQTIGDVNGVEALDILTPHRFRVAIGYLFQDREVMHDIRNTVIKRLSK